MKPATFLILIFWSAVTCGQLEHPKVSPFATVQQAIGLSTINIAYSRPAVTGRTIFGTDDNGLPGLVPYHRIWRVGANESTKITFDTEVEIMGESIPKGTYALYAFPTENDWEIVFHTNTSHWGDGRAAYNPNEDALRVKVQPTKVLDFQENFLISFDKLTHDSGAMIWHWAHTKIRIPITVDTKAMMGLQIQKKLQSNPTAQTYYEIARYYQEQGIKLLAALDYVNNALRLGGETYYFYRIKSLIQADLGMYKEAIVSATKSLQISETLGKDEFVRMNKKAILLWREQVQTKEE